MNSANYTNLKLETIGHTTVVTIANPPANTWTGDTLHDLTQLVQTLNAGHNIYSMVITGEGEKFFCAGADLKLFADCDRVLAREMARRFGEAFATLSGFRSVSIAAINGYAMGSRLECALACDLCIVEEHAQLAAQVDKQSPLSVSACKKLIQGARANPAACYLAAGRA